MNSEFIVAYLLDSCRGSIEHLIVAKTASGTHCSCRGLQDSAKTYNYVPRALGTHSVLVRANFSPLLLVPYTTQVV